MYGESDRNFPVFNSVWFNFITLNFIDITGRRTFLK
jgi:hypothetical protein